MSGQDVRYYDYEMLNTFYPRQKLGGKKSNKSKNEIKKLRN